ncbi:ATP-dependent Clp protease ATP-binding subunit CLPT2, chloroplastic-like [Mangifera indica]|uniref:ATP-dependent Clp protease ATP-binding subunit CLPT2, chloroplastic-like n=1 Tax=Mangifera indica TaxID=29780 RepID=UPI001CFBFA67|nr:ATP-dependent Clp protease ATP-binding subunit CLPT2, chloroplastic-like [Mangifera indica]
MAAHFLCNLPPTLQILQLNSTAKKNCPSSPFPQKKWLIGARIILKSNTLSLQSSHLKPDRLKRRPIAATVLSSLPTAATIGSASAPKWSCRAIKSFVMAELEARKLKYPNTGTEALLMGILIEGTSEAAKFLRANRVTLSKVREETVKLLGKGEMYFFSPEHPPLTEAARRAIDKAIDKKLKSGDSGELTTCDLLLGIWSEVDSAGHKIMATLDFSDDKAEELESLISKPGFVAD